MKLRKAIAYCYPTSQHAEDLGQAGYYVTQSVLREDGTYSPPYIHQGHDVFDDKDDSDLLALFNEVEGDICPFYAQYNTEQE